MHLLITGGCGFIGSNFIRYILRHYAPEFISNVDALTYAGYIENTADLADVPLAFVDQCVDAIRAIIREHHADKADEMAFELSIELRALADELVGRAAKADEAAADPSPPLAPS